MSSILSAAPKRIVTALASAVGAALIGWAQNAAGAVPMTIADALAEKVSITQFGGKGNDAFDNKVPINLLLAHCSTNGKKPYFPAGIYRTSGAHYMTVAGGVASPCGDGSAASIIKAIGDQDVLTIDGVSECAVRGLGFDKVTRNSAGRGLVILNTAYALVEQVSAFGFGSGIYTQAVLTSVFIKPLTRFCGYGLYFDYGPNSNPNAITVICPSTSLNDRWGMRVNQPAGFKVVGGSCEGNGWGVPSFHGGIYLSNAGGEGGVGASIDGLHMEQNAGDADIHIAQTMNAGTVFNIRDCSIFPIDNVHFTANRIYVENSVLVVLNVRGNNFKHIGTYTPNAARKYIAAIDTTLLKVNTGGDSAQFFNALETPNIKAWGPNVVRAAMCTASASVTYMGVVAGSAYNVASAARIDIGKLTVTFARPMSTNDYQVILTSDAQAKILAPITKTTASFTVQVRDLNGNPDDSGFDVLVMGGI